ncbi:hypothetical protein FOZ62_013369 [Perkinsus olseni]|uniref:Uncharacterized protein n=1 Tax=Perkinsus olseni TaxID=32597 RepID=A0A7J6SDF2_PEROL|nr:hypothetical protein FOZ62_013369 [Perkinsus olseni]
MVDYAVACGKTCSIHFSVDSQTTARWVATNKSSCRTLEKHAVARLVGIFSEIVQHWRDIGVQYEVKLVPGKTNEVADRLSRLAQEHDLANTIYGNTLSDGWMDEKCFIPPNDSKSADVSDVASLLTIEEVSDKLTDGNDYLDLYNDLLIVRAFSAWKKHAGQSSGSRTSKGRQSPFALYLLVCLEN